MMSEKVRKYIAGGLTTLSVPGFLGSIVENVKMSEDRAASTILEEQYYRTGAEEDLMELYKKKDEESKHSGTASFLFAISTLLYVGGVKDQELRGDIL